MGQHLSESAIDTRLARWVAALGLIAALAAMALPTGHSYTPEIASVLAVGALAFLAGHAWGLLIVALADVLLLGNLWPLVILDVQPAENLTSIVALACALPGLALLGRTLPGTVEVILGSSGSRWQNVTVYSAGTLLAAGLVVPFF